jgi:hypothetical protein
LDVFLPFVLPRMQPGQPDPNRNTTTSLANKQLFVRVNDSNIFAAPKPTVNASLPGARDWADFGPLV